MRDALLSQPIVPLNDSHDGCTFRCGMEALDYYFQRRASQDQRRRIAACFVLADAGRARVAGYYTLCAYSVVGEELDGQFLCTLLGRLAVDAEYRDRGIGKYLLSDALQRSLAHSAQVPSGAVVVDAKNEAAHAFYLKHGFISFPHACRAAALFAHAHHRGFVSLISLPLGVVLLQRDPALLPDFCRNAPLSPR
jgi:GNAT superfamily N-acetyltransferase